MKRDQRLYPLSWNHQNALAFAFRVQKALKKKKPDPPDTWIVQLQKIWQDELNPHFQAEEEVLFPAVKAQGKDCNPEIQITLQEHIQLAGLVQMMTQDATSEGNRTLLKQFADLLTQHIRFEERTLFPRIEKFLPREAFNRVGRELAECLPVQTKGSSE